MTAIADHLAQIKSQFPNLSETAEITSPSTAKYNCIAYAAGDQTRWWWPDAMGLMYWPPGCFRLPTLPVFQAAFEKLGFVLCADGRFEPNFQKIAIFHSANVPTHAAKQLPDGKWSSKLGQWFDVSHSESCLCGFQAQSYGEIAFFMKK